MQIACSFRFKINHFHVKIKLNAVARAAFKEDQYKCCVGGINGVGQYHITIFYAVCTDIFKYIYLVFRLQIACWPVVHATSNYNKLQLSAVQYPLGILYVDKIHIWLKLDYLYQRFMASRLFGLIMMLTHFQRMHSQGFRTFTFSHAQKYTNTHVYKHKISRSR